MCIFLFTKKSTDMQSEYRRYNTLKFQKKKYYHYFNKYRQLILLIQSNKFVITVTLLFQLLFNSLSKLLMLFFPTSSSSSISTFVVHRSTFYQRSHPIRFPLSTSIIVTVQ